MVTFIVIAVIFVVLINIGTSVTNKRSKQTYSSFGDTTLYDAGMFKDRPKPQPKAPYYAPIVDPPEPDLPEMIESVSLNLRVQIKYIDAKGQTSFREITVRTINKDYKDSYYLSSYCHVAMDNRTFKLVRIKELTDIETGEIYSNPAQYFIDRFNDSPLGEINKLLNKHQDELLVLCYIARADGTMRAKERSIIVDYFMRRAGKALDTTLLETDIRNTFCTAHEVRAALKHLTSYDTLIRQELFDAAANIVATEKSADAEELGVLELIRTGLNAQPSTVLPPLKRARKAKA